MYRKRWKDWEEVKKRLKERSEGEAWKIAPVKRGLASHSRNELGLKKIDRSQFGIIFKKEDFGEALRRLGIKKEDGLIVAGAGYTGKLPRALGREGYTVAYSDISPEFVKIAKEGRTISRTGKEIPAKKLKAFQMDLIEPHIKDYKLSAIVSFEPTPTAIPEEFKTMVSQNLGAKNGLVLFIGGSWSKFPNYTGVREYLVKINEIKVGKTLVARQFKIPEEQKQKYLLDREAFELHLRLSSGREVAKELGITEKQANERISRFKKAFELE